MNRKGLLLFVFFVSPFISYNQINEMNSDSEEYVYQLPFEKGKKVMLMQGYNGTFSHKNKFAIDFRLRKGRKIYAARGGDRKSVV